MLLVMTLRGAAQNILRKKVAPVKSEHFSKGNDLPGLRVSPVGEGHPQAVKWTSSAPAAAAVIPVIHWTQVITVCTTVIVILLLLIIPSSAAHKA